MFKVLGSDGQEYGPVAAETLRQWIAERRAGAETRVRAEGSAEWVTLSALPEFADALAAAPRAVAPPPIPPRIQDTQAASAAPVKTSKMAVASLVLGLVGFCGITAIVGLVLGIVAKVRIRRSNGRLKGKGLAIAGICVSSVMLFLSFVIAGLLVPVAAKAKYQARSGNCESNLRQVGLAVRLYADEHDGRYPSAASWCDAVEANVQDKNVFHCPFQPGKNSSYGFNKKLEGRMLSSIPNDTVMLFEIEGAWNFSGGTEDVIARSPHGRSYSFAFADGSVRQITKDELPTLRWEP